MTIATLYVANYTWLTDTFPTGDLMRTGTGPANREHFWVGSHRTFRKRARIRGALSACLLVALAISPPSSLARSYAYQLEALAFLSESTWEGEFGDSGLTTRSSESGESYVPSGYLIKPINDDFSFGFSVSMLYEITPTPAGGSSTCPS
jgi:hypothetical protein